VGNARVPAHRRHEGFWLAPDGGHALLCGLALTFALVAGVAAWSYQRPPQRIDGAVGTSGVASTTAATDVVQPVLIQEVETITGTIDGHELVGRKVDLHAAAGARASDMAFWMGSRDNRILVVISPRSKHRRVSVRPGQQAAVSGMVRRLPPAAEMMAWNLTAEDAAEAADRRIYISADSVASSGHGHAHEAR